MKLSKIKQLKAVCNNNYNVEFEKKMTLEFNMVLFFTFCSHGRMT